MRITAFVLRALLAHVQSDADNLNVLIAYEIIYNTGFFGLLYSVYSLVSARYVCPPPTSPSPPHPFSSVAASKNPPNDPLSRILRHHFLFRIALMAAVALGITGAIQSGLGTTPSTVNTGNTLRKAAIYIFLVCSILVFLQILFLARVEFSGMPLVSLVFTLPDTLLDNSYRGSSTQIGATYDIFILLAISLLLVAREAFFTATATNTTRQNDEAFWYPFSVVTEFIAVVLFAAPGLVPDAA